MKAGTQYACRGLWDDHQEVFRLRQTSLLYISAKNLGAAVKLTNVLGGNLDEALKGAFVEASQLSTLLAAF